MLRFDTAGESHGPRLTAVVNGFPSGFHVNVDAINQQLRRRQTGLGRGGRMKIEQDQVVFNGGLRHSVTTGAPLALSIENKDWENWIAIMDPVKPLPEDIPARLADAAERTTKPRPGHADLSGGVKFGHRDLRNILERASARETAMRTAVCCLGRQLLEHFGVRFAAHVVRIGTVALDKTADLSDLDSFMASVEASEVRCFDPETAESMAAEIKKAQKERDSLGGVVELVVRGLPVGLGGFAQGRDRLDSRLAGALMSIPSAKGVEFGLGFGVAEIRGSEAHDEIVFDTDGPKQKFGYKRLSNRAGGLEGGMTNGEDVIVRIAIKPISTLYRPLRSVDVATGKPATAMVERTDSCVVPVVPVIAEAIAGWELASVFCEKFGGDSMNEMERSYKGYTDAGY